MNFTEIIGKNFDLIEIKESLITKEYNDFGVDEGLEPRIIIKAVDHTFEIHLNADKVITTVFLYPNEFGEFALDNIHVNFGRKRIRQLYGNPDKHGDFQDLPIIGKVFGFDRYDKDNIFHFEYMDYNQEKLKMITLMKNDFHSGDR